MSLLPPHAIDEFQRLWKKHYGADLSREEATARAHQVFALVRLIVQDTTPAKRTDFPRLAPSEDDATTNPLLIPHVLTHDSLSTGSLPDTPAD